MQKSLLVKPNKNIQVFKDYLAQRKPRYRDCPTEVHDKLIANIPAPKPSAAPKP
jgi:hypothetical protein